MDPTTDIIPVETAAVSPTFATPEVDGGGSEPTSQPENVSQPQDVDPPSLPPKVPKKRKANASGPRQKSTAWEHFVKLPEDEVPDPTAACNYCGKRYLCDSKTHGTSNLLAHLKNCPKYNYKLSQDRNQTVLTFAPGSTEMATASLRFNVAACRKALATYIVVDEQSFRAVEGEGFKNLCRQLQPQFTVPSRHTVARDCFLLYLEEKVKLITFFRTNSSRVALTTDCWTSVQNLNYLTLTSHFINKEWNYQKRIISFCVVPNHKGETVANKVEEILRKWGLKNLSTITMDNASSNDVAANILKRKFKNMNGVVLDGEFFHVRCCAHILNLVVNDGLKDMESSITKIRHAIRFVRSSPQRLAKFKDCIEYAGISSHKLVCLDVPTRWNSTYLMLEAADKFQVAFERLEFEDCSYAEHFGAVGTPSCVDWEIARTFTKFLNIFFDATNVFSTSVHVSIHSAFHQLSLIYTELKLAISNETNQVLKKMGQEMKSKYDKYWGNLLKMNQLIYFGVILDPRYKFGYVEWSFNEMYKDEQQFSTELTVSIQKNLCRMYDWYATTYGNQNTTSERSQNPTGGVSSVVTHAAGGRSTRADAYKRHLKDKNSIDQKNEIERYLFEQPIDGDDKFDLLLWWKQNSGRFPILSNMAKDILATPVSTVASESAFSTGGRVIDSFRSCLKPEMAEALICSQNWLRPSLFQFKDVNLIEMFESSEEIVTELCQPVANVGRAGGAPAATGGGVGPSQSQPIGCD